jgi:hypothetical protein
LLPVDSIRKEGKSVFGIQFWIKAVQQVVVQFVTGKLPGLLSGPPTLIESAPAPFSSGSKSAGA